VASPDISHHLGVIEQFCATACFAFPQTCWWMASADVRASGTFQGWQRQPVSVGRLRSSAEILAGAANLHHAALPRSVSAAGLAPTSGEVVTESQSDSSRTDSPVRILNAQPRSRVSVARLSRSWALRAAHNRCRVPAFGHIRWRRCSCFESDETLLTARKDCTIFGKLPLKRDMPKSSWWNGQRRCHRQAFHSQSSAVSFLALPAFTFRRTLS